MRTTGLALLFLAGALGITLLFAATVFGVPTSNIPTVALILGGVGGGAGLLALPLTRPAVLRRVGGIREQLVGASLLGSLLLFGMVVAGALAMFVSARDLAILLTMLLFVSLLAVGFSLLWATPVARRIERVRAGTARLASGELGTELPVDGHDEIALLAEDFNRMAATLEEAKARERELEQVRRDLVAAVSHDLRTPLAAVRALIEAVAEGVASDPETEARYLRSAQREISHLSQLVNDLFELAQIDAGVLRLNLEPASLHDLISDTLSSLQSQAEQRGVRLIGEVADDVDPALMDPPRLQRVLYNLIDNAFRHTPAGGTILLRAEFREEVVRVEVADTGEGIAPEDLPHIFEHSFRGEEAQTHSETEGTPGSGLGLAIARGLVEAHGGTISAESRTGEGTRFCFTLRRA